jgi:hypothetical protein
MQSVIGSDASVYVGCFTKDFESVGGRDPCKFLYLSTLLEDEFASDLLRRRRSLLRSDWKWSIHVVKSSFMVFRSPRT